MGGLVVEVQALNKAAGHADMPQFEAIGLDAQFAQGIAGQLQDFRVREDRLAAKELGSQLGVLAIASPARRLVAKDRPGVLEPQGQRLFLILIKIEAANRGRIFRAQAMIAIMQAESIEILPQLLAKARKEEVAAF